MSYIECPFVVVNTLKCLAKSHLDEVILGEYGIPVLGRIPMAPAIAAASDAGNVERTGM